MSLPIGMKSEVCTIDRPGGGAREVGGTVVAGQHLFPFFDVGWTTFVGSEDT